MAGSEKPKPVSPHCPLGLVSGDGWSPSEKAVNIVHFLSQKPLKGPALNVKHRPEANHYGQRSVLVITLTA